MDQNTLLSEDDDVAFIEEIEEMAVLERVCGPRKSKEYRNRTNPLVELNETDFRKKYRLTKSAAGNLLTLIREDIMVSSKGSGIKPELQLLIALRYWGRGEIQDDAAEIHGISQQSMTNVSRRVALAIVKNCKQLIKMPTSVRDQIKEMEKFKNISGLKTIIGAIDGTHIRIPRVPGESGLYYINRKNYSSLNIQIVCDASLKIRDIVAHWRGSTHDSRIFNECRLKERFESGEFYGRLLGDSGYACTRYLFTPILNPSSNKEEAYNAAHIRTRNTVERCIGVWKQRFRCLLRGFTCSLENSKLYIVALAILHNFAIEQNDPQFEDDNYHEQQPVVSAQSHTSRGNAARSAFIEENF